MDGSGLREGRACLEQKGASVFDRSSEMRERLRGRRPWMAGHSGKRWWGTCFFLGRGGGVLLPDFPASALVCRFKLAQQGPENARVGLGFYYSGQIFNVCSADVPPHHHHHGSMRINSRQGLRAGVRRWRVSGWDYLFAHNHHTQTLHM